MDALGGFTFDLEALDGRVLHISVSRVQLHLLRLSLWLQSEPGRSTKPGEILCLVGEGMPMKRNPMEKVPQDVVTTVTRREFGNFDFCRAICLFTLLCNFLKITLSVLQNCALLKLSYRGCALHCVQLD